MTIVNGRNHDVDRNSIRFSTPQTHEELQAVASMLKATVSTGEFIIDKRDDSSILRRQLAEERQKNAKLTQILNKALKELGQKYMDEADIDAYTIEEDDPAK